MIEKKLSQYITNNAQHVVINRATTYSPTLLAHKQNAYHFECLGNQSLPYDVHVDIQDPDRIVTSCNCLYDGHGICKHQVAAVDRLITLLENKLIKPTVEMKMEKVSKIGRASCRERV